MDLCTVCRSDQYTCYTDITGEIVDINHFGKLVQNFELMRVGGTLKGHQFAPLAVC